MDNIIQGTKEWYDLRRGKITASRIADVMAKTKTGYGASRANYMAELIIQIITDTTPESYTSPAMQWGTECEPQARDAYSFYTGCKITEVGFIIHPDIHQSGASPDGLIGEDGLLEIKCPNSATHLDTLLSGKTDRKYILQMQWQMACTGRKWCDFVSYDPRFPEHMSIFIKRIDRDDELIDEITTEVMKFSSELNSKLDDLKEKYQEAANGR